MRRRRNSGRKRMVLGITGSFGSGKTTVARIFARRWGAQIIDADRIAHHLIKPLSPTYKKIINTFGENILKKNNTINRQKVAYMVFNNQSLLKRLNKLMHPQIIRIIKRQIRSSKAKLIILDAPLLIEAGLKNLLDKLIVVKITRRKQIERIMKNTSFTKSDILNRIKNQLPLSDKVRLADFIIDNSGTMRQTRRQTSEIMNILHNVS